MKLLRKNIVKYLLLLLFAGYCGGVTLFIHSHKVEGREVTHSHPYSSPDHQHSNAALQVISQLNNFSTTVFSTVVVIAVALLLVRSSYHIDNDACHHQTQYFSNGLRAPPVL